MSCAITDVARAAVWSASDLTEAGSVKTQTAGWSGAGLVEILEARKLMSVSIANGVMRIRGTAGDDIIEFASYEFEGVKHNVIYVNDRLYRFDTDDVRKVVVWAGRGDDLIFANAEAPFLHDVPFGAVDLVFDTAMVVRAGLGEDVVHGSGAGDTIKGGDGDDCLFGNSGDDLILGNSGHDTLNGIMGSDVLMGGLGDDRISGNQGDDMLSGGAGNDVVFGNQDDSGSRKSEKDSLDGGRGRDSLYGDEAVIDE